MRRLLSLAATAPGAVWTARGDARIQADEFGMTVDPILGDVISDPEKRAALRRPLLEWALKGGFLAAAYSRLAGLRPRNDLIVLCGAVGRLYDDLLDETVRPGLAGRLTVLFRDEEFAADDELESMLAVLYTEIRKRLGRDRSDPVFQALTELHTYQQLSDLQHDPKISGATLSEITFQKGALTIEVLYSMTRTRMPQSERALVHLVGGTLQLLDDYLDRYFDQRAGVTTPATRDEIRWSDLWQSLNRLHKELAGYYDRRRAARFIAEMRMLLCLAGVARLQRADRGLPVSPSDETAISPLRLLLRRGSHVPVSRFTIPQNAQQLPSVLSRPDGYRARRTSRILGRS